MSENADRAVPSEALLAMVEVLKDTHRHIERLAEIHPSRRGLFEMGEAYKRAEILTQAIANSAISLKTPSKEPQ